jgi:hypothetical protein
MNESSQDELEISTETLLKLVSGVSKQLEHVEDVILPEPPPPISRTKINKRKSDKRGPKFSRFSV